ncbi:MAG: glycosyltransferase [Desulfosporosinus sp.]|nr:glycosyltransferase [Desulfosporosinus sp.]
MGGYKIVAVCRIYDEIRKGNLERFTRYVLPLVNALVVYDGGSTDGSYEYMQAQTPYVIRAAVNDIHEREHYQILINEALALSPDFILWLDADEVLTATYESLQALCDYCVLEQINGLSLQRVNFWRSLAWYRLDGQFGAEWNTRLWRVTSDMSQARMDIGLSQLDSSSEETKIKRLDGIKVLHYGFSNERQLAYRYLRRRSLGYRGYNLLDRFILEDGLAVMKFPQALVPGGLWVDDEAPRAKTWLEPFEYIEQFRDEVFKEVKFSFLCPVVHQAELDIYEQLIATIDLHDKEILFIVDSDNQPVQQELKDRGLSHCVSPDLGKNSQEESIGLHRAYNSGAEQAKGDFLIFVHPYLRFEPGWLEALQGAYHGHNCLSSPLVSAEPVMGSEVNLVFDSSYVGVELPLYINKAHFQIGGGFGPDSGNAGGIMLINRLKALGINHEMVHESGVYSKCQANPHLGIAPISTMMNRPQVSIIITAFQRAHLLKWQLHSLAKQNIPFTFETIVINDGVQDDTDAVCQPYLEKLKLRYIFSGQRNLGGGLKWRPSGFPINIAARQSCGEVLIIACGEMFHLEDTILPLVYPVLSNPKLMGIPKTVKSDPDGSFLKYLEYNEGKYDLNHFNRCPDYSELLPYLIAISREEFFSIRGLDEDFTGIAHEDGDLVARLKLNGCTYINTEAQAIHLYHPRFAEGTENFPEYRFNLNLYYHRNERLKRIVRNESREWGRL